MITALANQSTTATAVADLVLARMALPSTKPASPLAVREDVGKLLGVSLSGAEFDALRSELAARRLPGERQAEHVHPDRLRPRAGTAISGCKRAPARTNWSTVIAKFLFPRAAGLSASAAAKLNDGDKLAAFILKRRYGLAAGAGSTVNQVLEAVACQRLGFPAETTLQGVLCAVLSKLMGSDRLTKEKLVKQLPLFETGLTAANAGAARCKLVRDWLGVVPQPPQKRDFPPTEPFDLTAFAATLRALAARSLPEERFHDNKVFIAPLWRSSPTGAELPAPLPA